MGDLSAEPSMEEILSSIKRIIAEEGEAPVRGRRMGRAVPGQGVTNHAGPSPAALAAAVDEVLELSDPMPATPAAAELSRRAEARAQAQGQFPSSDQGSPSHHAGPARAEAAAADAWDGTAHLPRHTAGAAIPAEPASVSPAVEADVSEPIASHQTVSASRGALDELSRMLVRPEPGSDNTLEGLVREMLRPMLRDWLDRNLPALVEELVSREIARISRVRD